MDVEFDDDMAEEEEAPPKRGGKAGKVKTKGRGHGSAMDAEDRYEGRGGVFEVRRRLGTAVLVERRRSALWSQSLALALALALVWCGAGVW